MLLAGAAAPCAIVASVSGSWADASTLLQATGAGFSALLLFAALALVRWPSVGRSAATLGILGLVGLSFPHLVTSPAAALSALIVTTSAIVLLWKIGAPLIGLSLPRDRYVYEGQAQGAAIVATVVWLLWFFADRDRTLVDAVAVGFPVLVSVGLAVEWVGRRWRRQPIRAAMLAATFAFACALALLFRGSWWWTMSAFVMVSALAIPLLHARTQLEMGEFSAWELLLTRPARFLLGTFGALSLGGAILLVLPVSASSGESIAFVDAVFTATSAVCVTGLNVLDTGRDFSPFGQLIILALIQVGGLGIVSFSTVVLWAVGRRMTMRHERAVAGINQTEDHSSITETARRILKLTFVSEACGAAILATAFWAHGDELTVAVWRGVFTAVSAFSNAGFALQSDSLVPYQHSPVILHTIASLVILGGLSPVAVFALPKLAQRRRAPLSAYVRLALYSTSILLVGGFLFILAFEWRGSLGELGFFDKFHNAWFFSVTLRSSGFNTIDVDAIQPATLNLMLLWMFIGGNPGGTAGGVKTIPAALMVLSIVQALRGQWTLEAFGKRIPERARTKSIVVIVAAMSLVFVVLTAIQLTQNIPTQMALVEVVSSISTTGLSLGATALLDGIGKTIIIASMFIGRVGGLALLMYLSDRQAPPSLARPEERLHVG